MASTIQPFVTFLTTVKNHEQLIKDCVLSVFNQSDSAWEYVVVDDGSDDRTVDILMALSDKEPRMKVVQTSGIGRGAALNLAISNAQASIVTILDSDDVAHADRVKTIKLYSHYLRDYSVIAGSYCKFFDKIENLQWPKHIPAQTGNVFDITNNFVSGNQVNHSTTFMKRSLFDEIGGYSLSRTSQFDLELWLRVICSGGRIGRIQDTVLAARVHDKQSFATMPRMQYVLSSANLQYKILKALDGTKRHHYFNLVGRMFRSLVSRQINYWRMRFFLLLKGREGK